MGWKGCGDLRRRPEHPAWQRLTDRAELTDIVLAHLGAFQQHAFVAATPSRNKVKNKPHAIRSYSIRELLLAVRRLPATMRNRTASKGGYDTHRDHWIGWLEEYDGPDYYGRSNWDRV